MNIERVIEDMERIRGIRPLKRFMVVDDDHDVVGFMRTILSQRGAVVDAFSSVEQGIQHLGQDKCNGHCYSRIFVDLSFPQGKQGTDLLEHVRRSAPNTPIAIVSGFVTNELLAEVAELGYSFIYKLASGEDFRHQLEKYL